MRNWVAGGVGVLVCVSTIMAEIPVWAIKEWVSPQSPPILSGAGGIYKEKEFYYMGLDGDLNRGLYAYDYFTETLNPYPWSRPFWAPNKVEVVNGCPSQKLPASPCSFVASASASQDGP